MTLPPAVEEVVRDIAQKLATDHYEHGGLVHGSIEVGIRRALASPAIIEHVRRAAWLPIESAPEGRHILLWFPEGEKGIGGIEAGTIYRDSDGAWDTCAWTHGGPNSGSDWEFREQPTMWKPLPEPPQ